MPRRGDEVSMTRTGRGHREVMQHDADGATRLFGIGKYNHHPHVPPPTIDYVDGEGRRVRRTATGFVVLGEDGDD